MTSSDDHRDELTDDELDDPLSSAADEVMNRAMNTTAPTAALLRLMDDDPPGDPPGRGIAVIMQRSIARHLDQVLDHARAFALDRVLYHADTIVSGIDRDLGFIIPSPAFNLARALGRASAVAHALDRGRGGGRPDLNRARELARSFAFALDDSRDRDIYRSVVSGRAHDLTRALRAARDFGFALAVAHGQGRGSPTSLAVEEAFDCARDLAWNLGFDNASSRGIGDDLARALDHTRKLFRSGPRTFPPEPDLESDLDLGRSLQLEQDLIRAQGLVQSLITALQTATVDVSGADLQDLDLDLDDLDILAGVIWSELTRWPPEVADEVWARSQPIREGTWQVMDGTEPDPADRAAVPG